MGDLGASTETLREKAETLQAEGQTVMYVASDGRFAGFVAVSDPSRTRQRRRSSSSRKKVSRSSW